jgi:BlaI family transcriptional regulator, penicillinase repressor
MARRPSLQHLTRRESQIMEILHRREQATVEEIRAELPDASTPSSVRKLLEIMMERGFLKRRYDGPRFVYFPSAPRHQASRSALRHVVETFFGNSASSAMAALIDVAEGPLSEEDYKRLSALLKRAKEGKDR